MKLSICMIVKNEESCLEKCLKSIKDADEIIILDTGSTDNTEEIAKKYTNKYITNEYKWNDNFAEAKNYAISKCTSDWILSIDADEYLEDRGIEKIKKAIIIAEEKQYKTLDIKMIAEKLGDVHYLPRLFKNNVGIKAIGAIHSYLNICEEIKTNIVIYYGYSATHKSDPNRVLRILQKEIDKNPNQPRELYYLAREYYYKKDYINAIKYWEFYVIKSIFLAEIADACLMLSYCYNALNYFRKAETWCLKAIKINTNFKEAINWMAQLSTEPNKSRWLEFAKTANNNGVLFIRTK